ncbi:TadE family protein [Paenibacillus sp. 32O-W]|uniref:TadE family protein n=1 Tax=Paenibacillus sp. 32O-W TaxID=1695218 RepID=UPI0009E91470|nr:TadE family protein [Paenibacillus sp. 32O-W]
MKCLINRGCRLAVRLRRDDGSFALEAAMVMPVILTIVFVLLFFGLYMYQNVMLYYTASAAAEQAAFGWDNSSRDPKSGLAPPGQYDGLYWRLGNDDMLRSLFGIGDAPEKTVVAIPGEPGEDDRLPARKLLRTAGQMPSGYEGDAGYGREGLLRLVEIRLREPVESSPLAKFRLEAEPATRASSVVADPVEFIRSVDLVRYYANKFGRKPEGRAQAGEVLSSLPGARGERH